MVVFIWVFLDSYPDSSNIFLAGLWGQSRGTSNFSFSVRVGKDATDANKDKLCIAWRNPSDVFQSESSVSAIGLGAWKALCVVWDNQTSQKFFIDGVLDATTTNTEDTKNNGGGWHISRDWSDTNRTINGQAAHCTYWLGTLLTLDRIVALFHGVHPFFIDSSNMKAYMALSGNYNAGYNFKNVGTRTGTVTGSTRFPGGPPVQLLSRYMSGH